LAHDPALPSDTTDFQHTVTTPAILFIGQVLSQCPLTNPLHAVVGLFLANLAFHVPTTTTTTTHHHSPRPSHARHAEPD
jgi:hypothetical protein